MRQIICYVYDEDIRYVHEYCVQISAKAGYTAPTVGDMDALVSELSDQLHQSLTALREITYGPFDLRVDIQRVGFARRESLPDALRDQADEYDADSVRRIRS